MQFLMILLYILLGYITLVIGVIILTLIVATFYNQTSTNNGKDVHYEHGMRFYKQHKFLWMTWWDCIAEGGSMGKLTKDGIEIHNDGLGNIIKTEYKTY